MKLLIHCIHYPVCSGRYMVDAYRRLGHEVYHDGLFTGRNIWGLTLPAEYEWKPEPPPEGWEPDLAILMDTAYQWHHETAPTIVHSVDNHVRDLRQSGINHYFLAHRNVSVMEWGIIGPLEAYAKSDNLTSASDLIASGRNMTHLPCAYDPVHFTPSPIPFAEREYDVACLGVMYPQRRAAVQALDDAGLRVLWGSGLVGDSYRDAYHNARISLCLSACGDVAQRVFETAANGNVVLTDNCRDYPILKPDGFYLLEGDESVVDAVRNILHEPEHAQAMIERSQAWVAGQTWDARAQVIVDWYEGRKHD